MKGERRSRRTTSLPQSERGSGGPSFLRTPRRIVRSLLELVYPPRCTACGAAVAAEPFCQVCAEAIEPVPPGCRRCGLPGAEDPCGPCRTAPPPFEELRAGGLFGGPLADAIHAFKYERRPALARPLGVWLASRIAVPHGATIVSVPLGRARRIERGYDQAALLADALARAAGGARRLRGAIRRTRETPPQVGRSRAARAANVAGAFEADRSVAGLELALVDDVVTTGATAAAAAGALRAAGAKRVVVLALARAE